MPENILLICWDFPPNYGIGGRRWGKFAKCLAQKGYIVHVVKSEPLKGNRTSSWTRDVAHPNIKTYALHTRRANKWLNDYSSPLAALKIRLAQLYLGLFFNGTIYDKALGLRQDFLALCSGLVTKFDIKNVIVTGAPFNLVYYTALLRKAHPGLNIIADYRDPWIDALNYGMNTLGQSAKGHELRKQEFAFQNVDYITAPNQYMLDEVKAYIRGSSTRAKFKALGHFFDPDDIPRQAPAVRTPATFSMVYAGALYTDSDPFLAQLANAMRSFLEKMPQVNLKLDVFTDHKTRVFDDPALAKHVTFSAPIGDKVFERIKAYDLVIILLSNHNKDYKTTKFFEFMPYKVPYLYVGPAGAVSRSIEQDGYGYVLQAPEDLAAIYRQAMQAPALKGFEQADSFSLSAITGQLIDCFV